MDNRANGLIIFLFGFLFIIAGVVMGVLTMNGTIDRTLKNEFYQAFNGYIFGMAIAIVLVVLGVVVIALGAYIT